MIVSKNDTCPVEYDEPEVFFRLEKLEGMRFSLNINFNSLRIRR